jgi:hypothetical protein
MSFCRVGRCQDSQTKDNTVRIGQIAQSEHERREPTAFKMTGEGDCNSCAMGSECPNRYFLSNLRHLEGVHRARKPKQLKLFSQIHTFTLCSNVPS